MWILIFLAVGGPLSSPTFVSSFTGIRSEADCKTMRDSYLDQVGPAVAKKLKGVCITAPIPTHKGSTP